MWVYLAAGLMALALGFTGGWKTATWRADAEAAELQRQTAADAARRFEHATAAARTYEVAREAQRVRTITITREVEREVRADTDCAVRPVPDGLRIALERAAEGATDQPGTDGAMPPASGASAPDMGGRGPGLRPGPVRAGGLPREASGPG